MCTGFKFQKCCGLCDKLASSQISELLSWSNRSIRNKVVNELFFDLEVQ